MATERRRLNMVNGLVTAASEILLAALALFAMDALAHLRLSVAAFVACWASWPVCLLAARGLRFWRAVPAWLLKLVEVVGPGLLLDEVNERAGGRMTLAQMAYAVVLVACLVQVWRAWLAGAAGRGHAVAAEAIRLVIAGAAGVWAVLPFFTDRLMGGVDARWYAYKLADFVTQWRAGVFPVFLGQGSWPSTAACIRSGRDLITNTAPGSGTLSLSITWRPRRCSISRSSPVRWRGPWACTWC